MPDSGSGLIKFVHASDLHLDSPFAGMKGNAPDHVRSALYEATFRAYQNIIKLCIDERVDTLLIAGDIFDSADRSLRAQLLFVDGLKRLGDDGIRTFACHGNHDPLDGWVARLDYPPTYHRFNDKWQAVPFFAEDPERVIIHGISYPTRDVFDNLVEQLGVISNNAYNIGLLHANVGANVDHALYAPCSLSDLEKSGLDYWALGHVHTRQVLSANHPTAVYPGNPQGRHPNESGRRGVYVVDVDQDGTANLDFRPMDTVRWQTIDVSVEALDTEQALIDEVENGIESALVSADGRALVLRINISGRGPMHNTLAKPRFVDDLLARINDSWANQMPFAWCERIEDQTLAEFNRQERLNGADFIADMLRLRDQSTNDSNIRMQLRDGIDELFAHGRYRKHVSGFAPNDDEFEAIVDDAEQLAVDLLTGEDRS